MTESDREAQQLIREALRELPRVDASSGFSRRLIERNRQPAARRARWPQLAAAAAVLALVVTGLLAANQRARRLEQERQRTELRARHEQLRLELAAIRQQAVRPPTLYLGSASDLDVVLDLDPWMQPQPATRPAKYTQP